MTQTSPPPPAEEEVPVIVVGAGPVGMLLAYQLHRLDVPCLLAERSLDTTKWPKMDLTNCRSMELLRVLGLADEYRNLEGSVDPGVDFNSVFVTRAMGGGKLLGAWVGVALPDFDSGSLSLWHALIRNTANSSISSSRDDQPSPSNAS